MVLQVGRPALDDVLGGFHVDPHHELDEGTLDVTVDIGVIDHPKDLVHRKYGLAQGLDELVFTLGGKISI